MNRLKLSLLILSTGQPHTPNLVKVDQRGLLNKCVKYNKKSYFYLYFVFFNGPAGQTGRSVMTDDSKDAESRKEVPFGGLDNILLHLWV